GRLGQALANYVRFEKRGFRVIGVFDRNPNLVGMQVRQCVIQYVGQLADFLEKHDVEIAALTIPRDEAAEVAKLLVNHGIRAIWNFAHVDLNLLFPKDIIIENVHLSESLMKLSCKLNMDRWQSEE
ncbi:MAG TPA: redox-sensing transcriptional repressor Rex, partial [Lachnospiraceae bacterium]|nr:redox-sensing transcriptional repressor Rex [Lachnospiraceae bacterium]